jgi:hypothetical protein
MGERAILARIDHVGESLEKADPDSLGKAIRLLDAMKRLAVGKKWVGTIGQVDAWALKARRRAGEIVEATEEQRGGRSGHGAGRVGHPTPRQEVTDELGISDYESKSWQALARIPEPVFEEYVEKVRAREEPGTISGALAAAESAKGHPETHVVKKVRSHDEIVLDDLREAIEHLTSAAGFDVLEEIEEPKYHAMALKLLETTVEYIEKQLARLREPKVISQ